MQVVADLQLHSKYSRAVSKDMVIATMAEWGKKKGIDLLATGDWTHTLWVRELQNSLEEVDEGIYTARGNPDGAKFLLSAEVSSIYSQGGKVRRVHTLMFAPNFEVVARINEALLKRGCNLASDGRPIIGLSCKQLAELVWGIEERVLLIPAHAWTPWFALYGSQSGFDSIEECFGDYSRRIMAVETGLSSDPGMNWQIKELENRAIVSFSDAHSPAKLGREATVFKINSKKQETRNKQAPNHQITNFTYDDVYWAIAERSLGKNQGRLKIDYTVEFYPEEGKYHYTGHRKCGVKQTPEETRVRGSTCHVCGKPLTVGVLHRVDQLADQQLKSQKAKVKIDQNGVKFYYHPTDETRPPYVMMVPLVEILAEVYEAGVGTKRVQDEYERLTASLGSEFEVLLRVSIDKLRAVGGDRLAEAISKVRQGDIRIEPGFDGEFGRVSIWPSSAKATEGQGQQMGLW